MYKKLREGHERGPERLLPALHDTGVDIVSFANNHVYDQGVLGLTETVRRLNESDLDFVGAGNNCSTARAPHIESIEGIQVGFVASTMLFNANLNKGIGMHLRDITSIGSAKGAKGASSADEDAVEVVESGTAGEV